MKTTVWVVLLLTVCAVLAKPARKSVDQLKLRGLLRKLRQSSDSCRELSESFGALTRRTTQLQSAVMGENEMMTREQAEQIYENLIDMLFDFDIVNDDQAREQYTCNITRASSLSELKTKLEQNGLLRNVFRMFYDGVVMAARLNQDTLYAPEHEFLTAVKAVGLLELDNARVNRIIDMLGPQAGVFFARYVPVEPFIGTNSGKCDYVSSTYSSMILQFVTEPDFLEGVSMVQQITGVDISDIERMQNLFCALIDGAESGVDGLYVAIDSHGIIDSLFRSVYPLLQTNIAEALSFMEQQKQQLEQLLFLSNLPGGGQYPYHPTTQRHKRSLKMRSYEKKHSDKKRSHNDKVKKGSGNNGYGGHNNDLPSHYYGGAYPGYGGDNSVYPGYGGAYPGYGGGYPGYGGGYPGYGGGYPGNGGGYPGNGGGYPGSSGPDIEEQLELITEVVRFLQALADSGLLSLTMDL